MTSLTHKDALSLEGKCINKYRFCRLLESGEHVSVYLGYDMRAECAVAIKVLHRTDADEARLQLFNEKTLLGVLVHEHIVDMLDFVESSPFVFLVTEYAARGSLRDCLNARTRLPVARCIQYIAQAADALQYMHNHGYVHRDVKPENMLLTPDESVLLCDLGIAVPIRNDGRRENSMGTALYVSPEQIGGYPSPRSDQYSLATVAYELLCGICPFSGPLPQLVWMQLLRDPPLLHSRRKKIPFAAGEVLKKALAKDPEKRFARIETFALELGKALGSPSTSSCVTDELDQLPEAIGIVQEHVTDREPAYIHTQLQDMELLKTDKLK